MTALLKKIVSFVVEGMEQRARKGGELWHTGTAASRDLSDVNCCAHPILSCFKDMGAGGTFDTAHFPAWESGSPAFRRSTAQ